MASTMTQQRRWVALLSPVLIWVLAAGCVEEHWGESHATGSRLSAGRPECPQVWDSIPLFPDPSKVATRTGSTGTVPGYSALSVSGPHTDIPEFNDCQKFIIKKPADGTWVYDSLYAIFAAFRLDSIVASLPSDTVVWSSSNPAVATVSSSGQVTGLAVGTVAIVATSTVVPTRKATLLVVVTSSAPAVSPVPVVVSPYSPGVTVQVGASFPVITQLGAETTASLPVAEIYTYGPGYPSLGIGRNFNCLYLYLDSGGNLAAKMIDVPDPSPNTPACPSAANPNSLGGTPLSVIRTVGFKSDDYPAVARWDWDPVNRQQYIGIKCGAAWCEIGPRPGTPFSLSASYQPTTASASGNFRVVGIKGWYDEQLLAIKAAGGHAVPSRVRGTVIPDSRLKTRTDAEFKTGWVPVAYIGLDTTSGDREAVKYYKTKFNLDPVPVQPSLSGMNTLFLCYGTRDDCRVPPPTPPAVGCGPDNKPPFVWWIRRWWVKIESANGGKPMYRCVTRRDHAAAMAAMGIDMPATTRWRWLAEDETTWDYCQVAGCCETDGNVRSVGWY